jgi:hypothetical protein
VSGSRTNRTRAHTTRATIVRPPRDRPMA